MLKVSRLAVQPRGRRHVVLLCCGMAHFLHDGFSDVIYILLPLWQAEFALTLAETGALKSCYSGMLAVFQTPAGILAERFSARRMLALGTVLAGLCFMWLGGAGSVWMLAALLLLAGMGSGAQHPLAATIVASAHADGGRRAALGIYNFTGDLGKIAVPMAAALVIAWFDWRVATFSYGVFGLAAAVVVFLAMRALDVGGAPRVATPRAHEVAASPGWGIVDGRGFRALAAIGIIDSATRVGFLTFLPFLLAGKGAEIGTIGLALGLTFAGGACGKFVCGVFAERLGILRTVILTELLTALGIGCLLLLPLGWALVCLPLVGMVLNGTSSVLYATVAEFVVTERQSRVFGLFYTLGSAASAAAAPAFGLVSDVTSVPTALAGVALLVLTTIPLILLLRPSLAKSAMP